MPSIKIITPISGGANYHIFNRGVNRQYVFFNPENYHFFLGLVDKYLDGYVQILAYCLLPNHFHLIIKVNDVLMLNNQEITNENEIGKFVVLQLRRMFIAYAMAVNIQEKRTGALFESKYKRLEIDSEEYLRYVIFYTHFNPEKHGLADDFRKYKYSSYHALVSVKKTKLNRNLVYEIFGTKWDFLNFHNFLHEEKESVKLE